MPDTPDVQPPAAFIAAVEALRAASHRSELSLAEIPAPGGIAPWSVAFSADVHASAHEGDSSLGTGRFVLFHDPEEPDAWGGPFRVVCYAQAPLEAEIGVDPFLADVAWSWLVDALDSGGADYTSASGTATTTMSTGYGELAANRDVAQLELRASWSPSGLGLASHVEAWGELLCMLAGLPPTAEGVSLLSARRAGRE